MIHKEVKLYSSLSVWLYHVYSNSCYWNCSRIHDDGSTVNIRFFKLKADFILVLNHLWCTYITDKHTYIYIHINIHTYIHIYIYHNYINNQLFKSIWIFYIIMYLKQCHSIIIFSEWIITKTCIINVNSEANIIKSIK